MEERLENEATERQSQRKCPWKTGTEKGVYGEQGQAFHCGLANFGSHVCPPGGLCLHEQPTQIRHWRLKTKGCDNRYKANFCPTHKCWNISKWIFEIQKKNTIMLSVSFTLFEIFIFCPKIQFWFPEKIADFFGVKNSWKCCGFGLLSCWQLWFHEKNCQKKWVKNSWKWWGFVKIEFLDKNLTFRIVWNVQENGLSQWIFTK